jgi:GT2 family glycosyltransferase
MAEAGLRVSVVVVVKNDRRVGRLLDHLERLPRPESREIVVVDASDGALDDIGAAHPNARWIPFAATTRISVAAQRNAGVRAARGRVIVFIDSDCVPEWEWLTALTAPILDGGESVTAGSVRSLDGPSIHDRRWEVGGNAKRYLHEAPTLNLAVARELIERHGGFEESLRFGSDIELTGRMVAGGARIRYVPEAVVLHEWGGVGANIRRALLYGEAHARLHKKHRWARRRLVGPELVYPAYAAFILGLPLTLRLRSYPLLLLVPVLKNAGHRPAAVVSTNLVHGLGYLRGLVAPRR